ncbi:MAG: uracil-DNA glycosylase [Bacillota bacterium]|nr:uracil-DNA glycosylase [Bacillota bacterium]
MITITEEQQSLFEILNSDRENTDNNADPVTMLQELEKTCLECQKCDLRKGCRQVVFGGGDPQARLMLVGEAPGADEDRLGTPFVGRAGQLLDRILKAAEIDRADVYITNIAKCRPPGNRLPLQPEVDACLPHLFKQLELINPDIVVCLGALATRTLIDKKASITRMRGTWHEKDKRRYIATFHPAALLRDPSKKKQVWEDFKEITRYYHSLGEVQRD